MDEATELLETAMYREVASQAFYEGARVHTDDPGAKALLTELAAEEVQHAQYLKKLKATGAPVHTEKLPDLKIAEYLAAPVSLTGAGLQETLAFAVKKEQESVEFYSRMMGAMTKRSAKRLCQKLVHQELEHKLKLEILYDDIFFGED